MSITIVRYLDVEYTEKCLIHFDVTHGLGVHGYNLVLCSMVLAKLQKRPRVYEGLHSKAHSIPCDTAIAKSVYESRLTNASNTKTTSLRNQ